MKVTADYEYIQAEIANKVDRFFNEEHQSEEENGKKDSNRNKYKTKKIIVMNSVNNEVSPNQTLRKRITNIPVSKAIGLGNKNFSASTYEKVNYKAGNKLNVLNKNKK